MHEITSEDRDAIGTRLPAAWRIWVPRRSGAARATGRMIRRALGQLPYARDIDPLRVARSPVPAGRKAPCGA